MYQAITFFIKISYIAPSNERVFLDAGWGIRDIRGPYIRGLSANIIIPAELLSIKDPALVILTLAVSNRASMNKVKLVITSQGVKTRVFIGKNSSEDVILNLKPSKSTAEVIGIAVQVDRGGGVSLDLAEIVALNEISIERKTSSPPHLLNESGV